MIYISYCQILTENINSFILDKAKAAIKEKDWDVHGRGGDMLVDNI